MIMLDHFKNGGQPAALLSDMDGLLLDTEQFSKLSFDALARDYELADAAQIFPQLIGLSRAAHLDVFRRTLPSHIDVDTFDNDWKQRYLALLEGDVPVKSGVVDFLQHCRLRGMGMAVVTSTKTEKAETFLSRAGLLTYFDIVIGGDQVENSKPHPDIYQRGAAALSVSPENCLALEDSNNGALSAYHAGATVLQIPDLAPQSEDVAALAIPVLDHISHVPSFLNWPQP